MQITIFIASKFIMFYLGMERNLALRGGDPIPRFSGAAPPDAILCVAPIVGTLRMSHGGPHHFQSSVFAFHRWIGVPIRWNCVMSFQLVVEIVPAVRWVV